MVRWLVVRRPLRSQKETVVVVQEEMVVVVQEEMVAVVQEETVAVVREGTPPAVVSWGCLTTDMSHGITLQ